MQMFIKSFIALLAFLALILTTLFSSGCSGDNKDGSDNVDYSATSFHDDGELILPDDVNRRVDKNGWETAMKIEQFKNVTITSYSGDVDKTNGTVMKIDGDKSFEVANGAMSEVNGDSFSVKQDMYFYKENGKNYRVVLTEKINQATGEVKKERNKQEDDEFGGITPEYLINSEDSLLNFVANNFDKFLFSDKVSLYAARFTPEAYPDSIVSGLEIYVGFLDGKLDCIKYVRIDDETKTFYSSYFSDYGTTVIEIPEV